MRKLETSETSSLSGTFCRRSKRTLREFTMSFLLSTGSTLPLKRLSVVGSWSGMSSTMRGGAGAVGAAAQQVVAGHAVEVRRAHHKVKAALAYALFVVGEQRLGICQGSRQLFLSDAAFFAQERQYSVETALRHGYFLKTKLRLSIIN